MKVSVGVITYCQENTIRQTLESILAQKGDYELEIVVGEDHGKDRTRQICEELASRHGSIILLPDVPNLGIVANFTRVMKACTGEYIGICAGDDYWCDDRKLEKQVAFMRNNPQYGVCSTGGYRLLVRKNRLLSGIDPFQPFPDGDVSRYYFDPKRAGGVYAMPLSLLIRRDILDSVPFDEFVERNFPVEDYPMQAIMSKQTLWGHIPDRTVVYRVYSSSSTFISFDHPKYMEYYRGLMEIKRYLAEKYPEEGAFDEFAAQEFVFYKEYLMYLHGGQYGEVRKLLAGNVSLERSAKYRQARKMSKGRITFEVFRLYKELRYHLNILNRT